MSIWSVVVACVGGIVLGAVIPDPSTAFAAGLTWGALVAFFTTIS